MHHCASRNRERQEHPTLSPFTLNGYVGHPIKEICPHGYDRASDNHCAHFVSHVLQLGMGYTCAQARGRVDGANIRVQELFALCTSRQEILECPTAGEGLIFVSERSNFRGSPTRIDNVPKKHVGIHLNGKVWHYSNTRHRVVTQTVGDFLFHYPRQHNALWHGSLPVQCRPTEFGICS
jgi:hypothetical protein